MSQQYPMTPSLGDNSAMRQLLKSASEKNSKHEDPYPFRHDVFVQKKKD